MEYIYAVSRNHRLLLLLCKERDNAAKRLHRQRGQRPSLIILQILCIGHPLALLCNNRHIYKVCQEWCRGDNIGIKEHIISIGTIIKLKAANTQHSRHT